MKTIRMRYFTIALAGMLLALAGCQQESPVAQVAIDRVETMPNIPQPYKQLNWKEKAVNFDQYAFDFGQTGDYLPFIWLDSTRRNIDQVTFGMYTVVGDVRQGEVAHIDFHESLTSLGALMSAGLVGIDKTNQGGFNFPMMAQNYFNSDTGWNIIMNNTNPDIAMLGGGYGRDWWYDVYPNLLYYAVCDLFPDVPRADSIQRTIANQFYKADSVLAGNYDFTYFDYAAMQGKSNHIPSQQDAAAGHAYVLYAAYEKFGDVKYLEGAKSAMDAMVSQMESRFYEVLLPFGAYVGARLNALHGTDYDVLKLLNWSFDGCKAENGRTGWGVIAQRWGDYDAHGLQGSITDGGGYAFLMNTHAMAWPLVPMVRYEPKFAKTIAKWMLNASNASRLFYPYEIDEEHQWLPEDRSITKNVIAYEGLRKTDVYDKESLKGVVPVALGDGPNWVVEQPKESMFSLYSSGHAGIYGAIIQETNVDKILQLNCLATNFYGEDAFPTYLYFNPYKKAKQVDYENKSLTSVDLYDVLTHEYIAKDVKNAGAINISPESAALVVELPHDATVENKNGQYWCLDRLVSGY